MQYADFHAQYRSFFISVSGEPTIRILLSHFTHKIYLPRTWTHFKFNCFATPKNFQTQIYSVQNIVRIDLKVCFYFYYFFSLFVLKFQNFCFRFFKDLYSKTSKPLLPEKTKTKKKRKCLVLIVFFFFKLMVKFVLAGGNRMGVNISQEDI